MTEYRKLDPNVRSIWTAALRSGDFVQGKKQLGKKPSSQENTEAEFCCLGVLAVVTPETSQTYWKENTLCIPDEDPRAAWDEVAQIPLWLGDLYGLDDEAQNTLTEFNDSGQTFEFIANWIDNNLGWGHNPNGHDWPQPSCAPTTPPDDEAVVVGAS